uniref:Ig lambda-6 chain C region n=1 Tax=Larimichthys crocea TaxID=215358 RepID=A0A0F8CD07_LARCR
MLGTLCTLITALTYVDAVIVLTQTPAVHTVSTGQEVVLKCNIQRFDAGYDVSWYKQVPGEAPQYVLKFHHSDSSPSFGTGFSSDRFNSKASSNIDYQFIIKRAEAGDSAVYYCHKWDTSAEDVFISFSLSSPHTPTLLTSQLDSSSLPPPVLTVFPPSSAELQSNKATLVCLSSQSVPFADVSWLTGGSPVSSGISTSTAVQQPDQTFQISSYLDIQTSDWNMDKVYTCKVSLGSQTSEKNINKSGCPTEE